MILLGVCVTVNVAAHAGTMSGRLEGSINGTTVNVNGTCSRNEGVFEFWSDGTEFAVSNDSDGDGMYLNIMVRSIGDQTFAALRYSRGGETIYNGTFEYDALGDQSLSVDTSMGRDDVPAKFHVQCQT